MNSVDLPPWLAVRNWYVTNGEAIVGPVDTDLLLRGITSARIPADCKVTQPSWSDWRDLDEVRELSQVFPTPLWLEQDRELGRKKIPEELVVGAKDAGEALLLAMQAAVAATRASAALVHRNREPFVGLVTSSIQGPLENELGQVIPRLDAARLAAVAGDVVLGRPDQGPVQQAVARRFSGCAAELAGVAMVPVFDGGALLAMIELARTDHAFRAGDAEVLRRVSHLVGRR